MYLMVALMISAALAACGGGGGSTGSTSPGTSGPATVSVSIASAPSYPAGTTFAPSTLSPTTAAPPVNSPEFTNVFVTVTKLALIPSTGPEFPDANGELENSSADEGNGFVTDKFSPVTIDLLNLNSSTGDNAATLLNMFSGVPAGEYSKIRVYYDNVVGRASNGDNTTFHPTANYHFDVHFVGGNLVIPVATIPTSPQGGIRFYSVEINVLPGLKYHQAGKSDNILLRPQVFATVVGALEYIVSGVADNVNVLEDGTFDILTPGGTIKALYDSGTIWAYSDNVLNNSLMVHSRDKIFAVPAFKDRAEVSAIGVFDDNMRLQASHITFTFPDFRIGKAFSTWPVDNTYFRLNLPSDNLVYALPDKTNPLYTDFRVPPVELVNGYNFIVTISDNTVKARGYAPFEPVTGSQGPGLQAFWISIDNNIGP
jgi:hypothetical protein